MENRNFRLFFVCSIVKYYTAVYNAYHLKKSTYEEINNANIILSDHFTF